MADEVRTEEVSEETTDTNADAITSEDTEVTDETTETVEETADDKDYKALYLKEKAESSKWEGRSKSNHKEVEQLREKVSEYEAKVTEVEDLRSELASKSTELARFKAALENGLSIEDTSFLTGSTEEEISAAAKKFAARIGAGTNRISLRTQGASTDNARPLTLQEKLTEQIRAAKAQAAK